MNILFIHGNYPAQFRQLLEVLGEQRQHDIRFLTCRRDHNQHPITGVQAITFDDIEGSICSPHALVNTTDQAIRRGELIQSKLLELAQSGFVPKLVFVHAGNGLSSLIKQLIPNCVLVNYFEWYFSADCSKVLLAKDDIGTRNMVSLRNLLSEHELIHCDAAVIPTQWQASRFPRLLQPKLEVVFDGIDTGYFQPPVGDLSTSDLVLEGEYDQLHVKSGEFLLSYATRGMEPLRGFPEFMRALPAVLKNTPQLKILIGGRDRSAYGAPAPTHNGSWKKKILDELGEFEGHERIVFTGLMNYGNYLKMLQRTNLHCYFTKPYVTSWSLFEAASCGTPILTNTGEATTGTLPINTKRALSWEEVEDPTVLADRISRLICMNEPRHTYLPAKFERGFCRQAWQGVINRALQKR